MASHPNITHDKFPRQSADKGKRVRVCFHLNTQHPIPGTIVRDDIEAPGRMIIQLDDGRFVLSTECQYQWVERGNG